MVDVGTGDGRFVLDYARQHPDTFCIGVDASQDGLIEASKRALKKPAKGGVSNVQFVLCAVENLPEDWCNFADTITVNYPWGSLLKAMVKPDIEVLRKIAALGKSGADIQIILNGSVFENRGYCQSLGLPILDIKLAAQTLRVGYLEAGIALGQKTQKSSPLTTWGQKLTKGADRLILQLDGRIMR